ncbi:MAG: dockerin type I domain-containing protein [Patescibacteria group bacterium]|nr:dockerin type I domain-containing protein [Patescibacteria group bacterium]
MKRTLIVLVVSFIFVLMVNADTSEIYIQTKNQSDIVTSIPVLFTQSRFLIISVGLPTSELNPNITTAKVALNCKVIAVVSNCIASINENQVTFSCIRPEGGFGKILAEWQSGQIPTLPKCDPPSLAIEMENPKIWSASAQLPLGSICQIKAMGSTIWVKGSKVRWTDWSNVELINRPGDINLDGVVNILDLVAISKQFGVPVSPEVPEDMNWDGVINREDLMLVGEKFGTKYSSVPQPAPPNRTIITWSSIKLR